MELDPYIGMYEVMGEEERARHAALWCTSVERGGADMSFELGQDQPPKALHHKGCECCRAGGEDAFCSLRD